MKKLTTHSQLLLHIYGELEAGDQRSMQLALHQDKLLQDELKKIQALKILLNSSCSVPSIAAIQHIKAYARAAQVFTDKQNHRYIYLLN